MRIETTHREIYQFEELDDDAKKKAIESQREFHYQDDYT